MKYISIAIIISIAFKVSAQNPTPFINFTDIQPDWKMATYDPTFVSGPLGPYKSGYDGKIALGIRPYKDKLLILENTFGQNPYASMVGLLLTMIDKSTGKIEWIHPWTENTGLTHKESYLGINYEMKNTDLTLTLGACRDTTKLNIKKTQGYFYFCKPTLRTIDLSTGNFVSQYNNIEDDYIGSSNGSIIMVNQKNQKFFINSYTTEYDTAFVNNVVIQGLNDEAQYESGINFTISDTSTVPKEIAPRNYFPLFAELNQNTLVIFFGDNYINDTENSPKRLTMVIADLSDKQNIQIKIKKDITNLLTFPQNYYPSLSFSKTNNGFTLGQHLYDKNREVFYYFNYFDKEGNHIAKIDTFTFGGRRYLGNFGIGEYNSEFYFNAVYRNENKIRKVDLFKISSLNGTVNLVKELNYDNPSGIDVQPSFHNFMDKEGNVYCGFIVSKTKGQEIDYNNQFYKFSAASLGIVTSTTDFELKSIYLFPNPTSDIINVSFEEPISNGELIIEDMLGHQFFKQENIYTDKLSLSVNGFPDGVYFVKTMEAGILKHLGKFVKN